MSAAGVVECLSQSSVRDSAVPSSSRQALCGFRAEPGKFQACGQRKIIVWSSSKGPTYILLGAVVGEYKQFSNAEFLNYSIRHRGSLFTI